jgi:hypothetical protein
VVALMRHDMRRTIFRRSIPADSRRQRRGTRRHPSLTGVVVVGKGTLSYIARRARFHCCMCVRVLHALLPVLLLLPLPILLMLPLLQAVLFSTPCPLLRGQVAVVVDNARDDDGLDRTVRGQEQGTRRTSKMPGADANAAADPPRCRRQRCCIGKEWTIVGSGSINLCRRIERPTGRPIGGKSERCVACRNEIVLKYDDVDMTHIKSALLKRHV